MYFAFDAETPPSKYVASMYCALCLCLFVYARLSPLALKNYGVVNGFTLLLNLDY